MAVVECNHCLLQVREKFSKAGTEDELATALYSLEQVLSQNNAPYSQNLLGLKACILLRQGSLEDAAKFASQHRAPLEPEMEIPRWPHWVAIQCYFFDGNLPAVRALPVPTRQWVSDVPLCTVKQACCLLCTGAVCA